MNDIIKELGLDDLPGEEWMDVINHEGLYMVSNLGRVKSLKRKKWNGKGWQNIECKILKQQLNKSRGYFSVRPNKNGKKKTKEVHQLVAESFLKHIPCKQDKVIDHINNIKTDNRVINLQVVTHRYNLSKDKKRGTSSYVGVSLCKKSKKWKVAISIGGSPIYLGCFSCELEAAKAYQTALKKHLNK